MSKKIGKKKIGAAAAIFTIVLTLFVVGSVPIIIADNSSDEVFDGPVTIYLNATDNYSGVAGIHYAVERFPQQQVPPPPLNWTYVESDTVAFEVTAPGNYTVHYYAVDNLGNNETEKTKSFAIFRDVEAPVTVIEIQGKPYQA